MVVVKGREVYRLDKEYQVEVHNFSLVFAMLFAANLVRWLVSWEARRPLLPLYM
jgi:hypothetical protein